MNIATTKKKQKLLVFLAQRPDLFTKRDLQHVAVAELNRSQMILSPISDSEKHHNNKDDIRYSKVYDTELPCRSPSADSRSYKPFNCSTAGSSDEVDNISQYLTCSTSGGHCLGVPLPQRKH
jgi:hypothetical protein